MSKTWDDLLYCLDVICITNGSHIGHLWDEKRILWVHLFSDRKIIFVGALPWNKFLKVCTSFLIKELHILFWNNKGSSVVNSNKGITKILFPSSLCHFHICGLKFAHKSQTVFSCPVLHFIYAPSSRLCGSRPSYTQHIYWYYYITLILVYHSPSTCFELNGSSSGTY
jgi:hypothetical protein